MDMGMTFGRALDALKRGQKGARAEWNGKGRFLWLKLAAAVTTSICTDPMLLEITKRQGGTVRAQGTICMYECDASGRGEVLTGWLAGQSDMLSEDWYIVHDGEVERAIDEGSSDAVVLVHNGIAAYQEFKRNVVHIIKGDTTVQMIYTDGRKKTKEELKAYIEEYIQKSR